MSQVASLTKRSYKLFVVNQFKSHPIVDIEDIKKFRRELHQHPEISGKEQETAKTIAARLSTLNSAVEQTGIGGHVGMAVFSRDDREIRKNIAITAELDEIYVQ